MLNETEEYCCRCDTRQPNRNALKNHHCDPSHGKDAKIAELKARIQNYLSNGGLVNPELMEHEKVRDLLMDVLEVL